MRPEDALYSNNIYVASVLFEKIHNKIGRLAMKSSASISLKKALALYLGDWKRPVTTVFHLSVFVFRAFRESQFRGDSIRLPDLELDASAFTALLQEWVDDGLLNEFPGFPPRTVFSILGGIVPSADEVICTVDPFAYVSHLSAMEYHGLTIRNPATLTISTPPPGMWREFASDLMEKELGDQVKEYLRRRLPRLVRYAPEKIKKNRIRYFMSNHRGAFKHVADKTLRVSTIGRTFLDMLRQPDLCGGLDHVLSVYREKSSDYLQVIVDEINRNGAPIDKIRAGFILQEWLGLNHPLIDEWKELVRRGGSRKLDSTAEYAPTYSKVWRLSINSPECLDNDGEN